ncbi:MAG: alpha/beta hydrolase [Candidatus Aminicenantes bacterium]
MSNETQFLQKPGGRIAYDDSGGGGPIVVAAPGMGDTRGVYRHLTPLLTEAGMRMVTFDLRGLGESSVDWDDYSDASIASDYIALVDHIGEAPAVLIGNSKTASSAVIVAADHPEKVSGLVLLGPFTRQVSVKWWQKILFGAMLAGPWGRGVWVSYYKRNLYPGPKPDDLDEYVIALSKNLAEPGRFKAFKKQAGDSHRESGEKLERVNQPCLIVMGTADPDFPDPQAEATELAELMTGEVLFVEGSGHYPQADNPKEVATAIIGFIKRIETTGMKTYVL